MNENNLRQSVSVLPSVLHRSTNANATAVPIGIFRNRVYSVTPSVLRHFFSTHGTIPEVKLCIYRVFLTTGFHQWASIIAKRWSFFHLCQVFSAVGCPKCTCNFPYCIGEIRALYRDGNREPARTNQMCRAACWLASYVLRLTSALQWTTADSDKTVSIQGILDAILL